MTRSSPKTHFHSSTLLRQLKQLAVVELVEPGYPVAERLASWMDFNDAMALVAAQKVGAPQRGNTNVVWLESKLTATISVAQRRLAQSISARCALEPSNAADAQHGLPRPPTGVALEIAASYEPYLRFYLALQRDMAANILKLRVTAREALAGASREHQTLAALDAAFAGFMQDHERKCLARVPLLLEQRFTELRQNHLAQLADLKHDDEPSDWMQPGQWLAVFCQEMQCMLLAELELRLQPVLGLLDALNNETPEGKERAMGIHHE